MGHCLWLQAEVSKTYSSGIIVTEEEYFDLETDTYTTFEILELKTEEERMAAYKDFLKVRFPQKYRRDKKLKELTDWLRLNPVHKWVTD